VITTEDRAALEAPVSPVSGQGARLLSELERLLREPGCPACGYVSEIERSFFSWFQIESFSSPQVQARLRAKESFAATNEREGSEIARQVLTALLETDVKVVFVTHMFDLATGFHHRALQSAVFLGAERGSDGARPFTISEGEPLSTRYGEDSYRKVFGERLAS
jgi:hypothetical protein